MRSLAELLDASAALHHHLCPRQVLGVRMGMFAGELLNIKLPQTDKRLLVIVETDGCFADGVSVATNCWVGRRTLRVEDFGKVAGTFVDTLTGSAIRLAPLPGIRQRALVYAPEAHNKWQAQLLGYQRLPAQELFSHQAVQLNVPIAKLVSRPGLKVCCDLCSEEILNGREMKRDELTLCLPCAGEGYYQIALPATLRRAFPLEKSATNPVSAVVV